MSRAVAVRCSRQLDVGSINEWYLFESLCEESVVQAQHLSGSFHTVLLDNYPRHASSGICGHLLRTKSTTDEAFVS